jgi:uncharacterized protein
VSEPPRFIVDAMHGSLARKLRIFGFDAIYFRDGTDPELIRTARKQRRIIITSDRGLVVSAARSASASVIFVSGSTDRQRILAIEAFAKAAAVSLERGPSRCADCNAELKRVAASEARSELPDKIAHRHRLYHRCPDCGRLYWKGRHWKKLRTLSSLLPTQ